MSPGGLPLENWVKAGKGFAINGRMHLALDRQGNIYVLQQDFGHLLKFSPSGTLLGTWGTYGIGPGQFAGASGIALDRQGNIYVADTDNNRIQEFPPLG